MRCSIGGVKRLPRRKGFERSGTRDKNCLDRYFCHDCGISAINAVETVCRINSQNILFTTVAVNKTGATI
jgi:hypothetical protein